MNSASNPALRSLERAPAAQAAADDRGLLWPAPRVVGPGRKERVYLERIESLEATRRRADALVRERASELLLARTALQISERVERGCQRRLDRLEERLDRREEELLAAHQAHKRMAVALGALQRENELLRQRLAVLPAPEKSASLLARLLGRVR